MQLADTSAWIWSRRQANTDLRAWFDERLLAGEIATCEIVCLELLAGVHSPDYERRMNDLSALRACPGGSRECARAMEVQRALAELGGDLHRAVKPADLLIAASAEAAEVELLHYDADYELVHQVTGQPMSWLAPRGSLQ